jgi:hypothetical protein
MLTKKLSNEIHIKTQTYLMLFSDIAKVQSDEYLLIKVAVLTQVVSTNLSASMML